MKRIFTICSLFALLLCISSNILAQETVQKKEYYDLYKTKISRIYNVNGNGMMQGDDKLYFESGKIKASQQWKNGKLLHSTKYFETGTIERIVNNNENEKPEGEQKWYSYKDGKHYQWLYANIKNGEVTEYKTYNIDGSIKEDYVKNKYYKSEFSKFTIANGLLNGKGLMDDYMVDFENGVITNIEFYKDFSGCSFWPYFKVKFVSAENIKREAFSSYFFRFNAKKIPFYIAGNANSKAYKISNDNYLTNINGCKKSSILPQELFKVTYSLGKLGPSIDYSPKLDNIFDIQLKNMVVDSLLEISKNKKNIREDFYKDGLLMWRKEYKKRVSSTHTDNNGNIVTDYNEYAVYVTKREYKRTYNYKDSTDVNDYLVYCDQIKACFFSPSPNDYTESYEAFNEKGELLASTEIDNANKLQAEMIVKLKKAKSDFTTAIGGSTNTKAENIIELIKTIDKSYIESITKAATTGGDDIAIKNEQINLYNRLAETINKIGLKQVNKDCKGLLNKEDLIKLLDSYK